MSGSLIKRIGVAGWGIPLILGVVFFGGWIFTLCITVICLIGQSEYYRLNRFTGIQATLGTIIGGAIPIIAHCNQEWMVILLGIGSLIFVVFLPAGDIRNARERLSLIISGLMYPLTPDDATAFHSKG